MAPSDFSVLLHRCVSQGRITKVINMKPDELRSMIEETAGTRMFEQKKQAALKTIEKKQAKVGRGCVGVVSPSSVDGTMCMPTAEWLGCLKLAGEDGGGGKMGVVLCELRGSGVELGGGGEGDLRGPLQVCLFCVPAPAALPWVGVCTGG